MCGREKVRGEGVCGSERESVGARDRVGVRECVGARESAWEREGVEREYVGECGWVRLCAGAKECVRAKDSVCRARMCGSEREQVWGRERGGECDSEREGVG